MVEIKTKLSNEMNYGAVRTLSSIKYIVLHFTANDGDTDESNANYFATGNRGASAHYFVDDDSITRSVPDNFVAYSVGGAKWADCNTTGGGKFYGKVTNGNSISIEMCDTQRNGKYDVSVRTRNNTIDLVVKLMSEYKIDLDHIVRHYDINGKHCPVYFMDNAVWNKFKGEIHLAFGEYCFKAIQDYLATTELPEWAETEYNKAISKGITDGTRPNCLADRKTVAIMTLRATK